MTTTPAGTNTAPMRPRRFPGQSKAINHVLRTKDGGTRHFARYGRKLAIAAMCTECLGWDDNPRDCTAPMCPLFPYRARTQATLRGDK